MRRSGTSSAGLLLSLRDLGALRPGGALDLGDAFVDRGQIRRRRRFARRRFRVVDRRRPASPIARAGWRVRCAARPAIFPALRRARLPPDRAVAAARLADLGLDAGDARGKIVDRGGIDLGIGLGRGGCRRRRPAGASHGEPGGRAPARPAPAPERAATIAGGNRAPPQAAAPDSAPGSAPAAAAFRVSPETSVASRSMVGGSRLARPGIGRWSGIFGPVIDHLTVPHQLRRTLRDSAHPLTAIRPAKHAPAPRTRHFRPASPPP